MKRSLTLARVVLPPALVALAIGACSAFGLGDYDLVDCDPDPTPCRMLDATLPEGECRRYSCNESGFGCELHETDGTDDGVLTEVWDGIDNDCDDWIDEGTAPADQPVDAPIETATDTELRHAVLDDGTLALFLTSPDPVVSDAFRTTRLLMTEEGFQEPEVLMGERCKDANGRSIECWLSQLAVASTLDALVTVGVQSLGCAAGQVRVGVSTLSQAHLGLGEGSEHAGVALDLHDDSSCTRSLGCDGAREPAIAVFEQTDQSEVLCVWRAATPSEDGDCVEDNGFALAGAVLPVERSRSATRLRAPTDARSEPLVDEPATGAPAIVASTSEEAAGFFVAFPSGDRVELLFFPRLAAGEGLGAPSARGYIEATSASDVALSIGRPALAGLAVAYRVEQANATELQLTAFRMRTGSNASLEPIQAPVRLPVRGSLVAGPALSYAATGFAVEDIARASGGWLVTWIEQRSSSPGDRHLIAARIAEDDLHVLDRSIALASGPISATFTYLKQYGDNSAALHCGYLGDGRIYLRRVSHDTDN